MQISDGTLHPCRLITSCEWGYYNKSVRLLLSNGKGGPGDITQLAEWVTQGPTVQAVREDHFAFA